MKIRNPATMTDTEVLAELASLDEDSPRFWELDRAAYRRDLYSGTDLVAHLARWATATSL